jgi:RimK family alpha-L-glutamate ligase
MTNSASPGGTHRIGVLSLHNSKETKAILNAIAALDHDPVWLREETIETWIETDTVRFVPAVDVVVNRLLLTKPDRPLEDLGLASIYNDVCPVLNRSAAVQQSMHKVASATTLAANGIPVPDTYQALTHAALTRGRETFDDQIVHKPVIGTNGRWVSLVPADELVTPLIAQRRAFIQQFIESHTERPSDIRVYVVGDRIIGAMRRSAPANDWRTNVALGGDVEDRTDTIDQRAIQLARQALAVLHLDYAGVDLIRDVTDEWSVLEVNATAGFKGFFEATGTSPAPYIAQLAIETVGGTVDDSRVAALSTTLDDSVPDCKPSAEEDSSVSGTVGYTERVTVSGTDGMETLVAKADTGAKRTSLDTTVAAAIGAGPITGTTQVRSGTSPSSQTRPLVEIAVRLGMHWQSVTASVDDRNHMSYPVLLGRDLLTGYQVDVDRRVDEG